MNSAVGPLSASFSATPPHLPVDRLRIILLIMSSITILRDDGPVPAEAAVQAAVRQAFEQLAAGRAVQPRQVVTDLPDGGDVIAYQAVLADAGVYAVKVSPYLPQPAGKAVVTAWTLLLSTRTGQPLLLADSARLTTERTAATTALAVDLLARPDAHRLAVIGLAPMSSCCARPLPLPSLTHAASRPGP